MKTALRCFVIAAIVMTSVTVRASSVPFVQGQVSGIELCPQSICGVALFAGGFKGRIGFNPFALGTVAVAVHHGELPRIKDACTPIDSGTWVLWYGFRKIEGVTSGQLCYNGDNTFEINVGMLMTSGGTGTLAFHGTLDHNVFPPTIKGGISQ